jgi:hypothetical protein
MDKITLIKTNGFIDVIESDIEISDDYVDMENIENTLSNYDDGIFQITNIKLYHDSGQINFGRWEIAPYVCIDNCKVKKVCNIYEYTTNAEKIHNRKLRKEKMRDNLQKFVQSFSNDKVKYQLCKVWAHDKLALREVSGETFQMFKTIHEFENDSLSTQNIGAIKKWINEYFNGFEKTKAGGKKIFNYGQVPTNVD